MSCTNRADDHNDGNGVNRGSTTHWESTEPSLSTLYIGFLGSVDFRKGIAEYIMPLYPPFWRPFKQNGGHFQKNRPVSETKRRRVSILTLCLCFVGHRFHRKYCRMHHAIASTILEAI